MNVPLQTKEVVAKIHGVAKLEKNDRSQINLSYPYVVLMLSEKTA